MEIRDGGAATGGARRRSEGTPESARGAGRGARDGARVQALALGLLAFGLGSTLALHRIEAQGTDPRPALEKPINGITISTHRGGQDWGSDRMPPTLRDVQRLGTNWVAIHPYASIGGDGTVRVRGTLDPADPPPHIVRAIREAHALGLKMLIVPHLAHWRSPFSWRGEIAFTTEEAWDRFFTGYERWIVQVATVAQAADALVIGSELDRTVAREAEWRRIIAKVRAVTPAPLIYAANWTDYRTVPFWDALDAVGVQAYFPLATPEQRESEAAIRAGWAAHAKALRAFAHSVGKPIVFTELGYSQAFNAPVEPWAFDSDGPAAAAIQELCMRVALEVVAREPDILGVFLWKWFPEPRPVGRNFQLATPGMRRVLQDAWQP